MEPKRRTWHIFGVKRFLDWAVTILYAPVFAGILIFYDIVLRAAALFGIKSLERAAVSLQCSLVRSYSLLGAKLEMNIAPEVRPEKSYIFVSNHQSMFDIPLFAWAFPRNNGKYITKKQLGQWIPAVSTNLKLGHHPLIDRDDRDSAVSVIHNLGERVSRGEVSAVIFPEGSRSRDGNLKPFKPAGLKTLLLAAPDAEIVPCCLDNSWRLMENNFLPIPCGLRLHFSCIPPIKREAGESTDELIHRIEQIISRELQKLRGHGTQTSSANG